MRIHKLYQCFAAAVLLFLPVACDNTDYSEKSPFDNSAYLNIVRIQKLSLLIGR